MIVYLGNKKLNRLYSGDKEVLSPTTVSQTNNILDIEYVVIGGGGYGGAGGGGGAARFQGTGGAGGGGGLASGSATLSPGTYPVVAGAAGVSAPLAAINRNGYSSSFNGLAVAGGGGGGNAGDRDNPNCANGIGGDGGSGGGNTSWSSLWGCGNSNGIVGQGYGGNGTTAAGGAGGAPISSNGGSGSMWLDGVTYSRGGGDGMTPTNYGDGGIGGNFFPNPSPYISGIAGAVIIRYPGTQVATGGTIIQTSGGYTYHTFVSGLFVNPFVIPSKQ
jgi:hypothetical protein